jgi:hypothetical protein
VTDLASPDIVAWMKREVAVPGQFLATFPGTLDSDIAGALADGLCRAQLDGWLPQVGLTIVDTLADPSTGDGENEPAAGTSYVTTPDISKVAQALVVVYTGIRWIQNQLGNLITAQRFEAPGPVISDTQRAASVLVERLKEVQAERTQLLERALKGGGAGLPVFMRDGYAIRVEELYTPEAMIAFTQPALSLL